MGYTQRDTLRTPGNFQDDAFQGHWHEFYHKAGSAVIGSGANADLYDGGHVFQGGSFVRSAVTDGVNGTPRTAAETRPKNVVVYWYIKVK